MTRRTSTPVLIVGAGPAGLVSALVLARQGVRSTLVERHPGTSTHPRASGVSTRTMEIFRRLGVEDEIRARSLDAVPMMSMSASLASPERRVAPLGFPTAEQAAAVSPTGPVISPQDHVEPVLLRRIEALGLTDIRFGTEVLALRQGASAVETTVVDRTTGERSIVHSEYVVAADGARSTVRDLLGIDVIGPSGFEHYASILFRADLWPVVGEPRYGLYMVGGPGVRPAIVAPMGPDDRFVFGQPGSPDEVAAIVADPELAKATIRSAAGVPDLEIEVLATMPLEFGAQLATRWRDGSVFLVGDAAHRMPPFGGRGMNTAVADAYNLGWKLAGVVRGTASPALLDSYEAERMPVGRHNVSLALARYPELAAEHGLTLDPAHAAGPNGTPDGLAEDLGYRYASEVVAATGGSRAPHAWLTTPAGVRSTIDLAADGFVLLTNGDGTAWRRAASAFSAPRGILRGLAAVGPAMAFAPSFEVAVVSVGEDVVDDGSFAAASGLAPGGAVLVRPDGHVAATWAAAPADRRAEVARAVAVALGHVRGSSVAWPAATPGPVAATPGQTVAAGASGRWSRLEPEATAGQARTRRRAAGPCRAHFVHARPRQLVRPADRSRPPRLAGAPVAASDGDGRPPLPHRPGRSRPGCRRPVRGLQRGPRRS